MSPNCGGTSFEGPVSDPNMAPVSGPSLGRAQERGLRGRRGRTQGTREAPIRQAVRVHRARRARALQIFFDVRVTGFRSFAVLLLWLLIFGVCLKIAFGRAAGVADGAAAMEPRNICTKSQIEFTRLALGPLAD